MLSEPLVIQRTKLIATLKEQLAARKKEHDEAEKKRAEAQQKARDNFMALVEAHPGWVSQKLGINFGAYEDGDAVVDYVEKNWGKESVEAHDAKIKAVPYPGHPEIEKWLRTLNLAENTKLEVKPSDDIYRIL